MSAPAPSAAPTPRAQASGTGWGRFVSGCLLGCGVVVGLGILAVVLVVQWALRSTPIPARDAFLGPETTGYLSLSLDREDEGTMAFLAALETSGGGGTWLRRWSLPIRGTLALGGNPERPEWFGAFSMSRGGNLLKLPALAIRAGAETGGGITSYRGETVLSDRRGRGPGAFAFVAGSMLVSSRVEGVQAAIDRVLDRDGGRPGPHLAALWPAGSRAAVVGALANRAGELARIAAALGLDLGPAGAEAVPRRSLPPVLAEAHGLTLEMRPGVPAADAVSGTVDLLYSEAAQSRLAELAALGPELAERLRARGIEARARLVADGPKARVEVELDNVAGALHGRSIHLGPVEVK